MLERIDIINNFNPLKGDSDADTFVRYRKSKWLLLVNGVLAGISFLFVFLAIINEYLGLEHLPKWSKIGGMFLVSFSFFINLQSEIYKTLLLQHLIRIENKNGNQIEEINSKLEAILRNITNTKKGLPIILLAILLIIGSVIQVLSEGGFQYWNYFILPLILLLLLGIYRTFSNYKALKENITAFENQTLYA
jgi:ABC-type siderophore export system fused ATPase/permease subunit